MDISWEAIKMGLTVTGMVIVPSAFVAWLMRRRASAIRNPQIEAEYLRAGFEVGSSWVHGGRVVSGTLDELPFVLKASPGIHTTPAMTVISVPRPRGVTFMVEREGSRDFSGRDLLEPALPDHRAREAARALFLLGFGTVGARGENLSAIRYLEAKLLPLEGLRAVLRQLAVIRAAQGAKESAVR